MGSVQRQRGRGRRGFTLIELLVVVAIIAVISGILLPVMIQARDHARQLAAERAAERATEEQAASQPESQRRAPRRQTLPTGAAPIIDALDLRALLASSYHRIGMDVYTRYRVDCVGSVVFSAPPGAPGGRVLLVIPFPEDVVEARDVQLRLRRAGADGQPGPAVDAAGVTYDRTGIYYAAALEPGQPQAAEVQFTAFGRERFDLSLPPARQLRSVRVTLGLSGVQAWTVPDEALQPSAAARNELRWEFRNLVSDRQISVLIPGAQAPLARVLLLSRLVAIAVLLFGAGFWFLSEQVRPGQLDRFRLGHFLLLALTYSLFFVVFAVFEFHGRMGTSASMASAAALSLPLLILHVSRVLDLRFTLTRVIPLALFTLAMVVNGVYGGPVRDYVWVGSAVAVLGYVTLIYPQWSAGRERHQRGKESAYTARRRALAETITGGIGGQMAELYAADAKAAEFLKDAVSGDLAGERARLSSAREPVEALRKEYEELAKRLTYLPGLAAWEASENCASLERDAAAFRDRLEPHLERLQTEVAAYREMRRKQAVAAVEETVHCAACGHGVMEGQFCPHCGSALPARETCPACSEEILVPVHLISEERQERALHCPRCGTRISQPASGRAEVRVARNEED